jgi:RNA polymerase sigma-70 factor, ECF subfamily
MVTEARPNPVLSFRDLAREQLPRLVSLARRLVGEDAEDVVQERL